MAVNQKLSPPLADIMLASIAATFDGGFIILYDGVQPTNTSTTEGSVNNLAQIVLPTPAFATPPVNAVLSKAAGVWEDTTANSNGVATWFRMYTAGDPTGANTTLARIDGNVGVTAGQFNLVLSATQITAGDPVVVDAFTLRFPTN